MNDWEKRLEEKKQELVALIDDAVYHFAMNGLYDSAVREKIDSTIEDLLGRHADFLYAELSE